MNLTMISFLIRENLVKLLTFASMVCVSIFLIGVCYKCCQEGRPQAAYSAPARYLPEADAYYGE